jgi:uncharacterized membrane protein YkvA (DUF1232 family)
MLGFIVGRESFAWGIMAFEKSKEIARSFKRELIVYQSVLRDERTPGRAKFLLALAIGYLCMPFDLIPDFIPVIGHLDDAIIVPALVIMALRSVPGDLISEHRRLVNCEEADGRKKTKNARS